MLDAIHSIYGVDFSGAAAAGNRIWITACQIKNGRLHVQECLPAAKFLKCSSERKQCLQVFREFVARQQGTAFGMDFPFSLPAEMIEENTWLQFVVNFKSRYPDVEDFRQKCREYSAAPELKRLTDIESQAPFSPYNLWVYKQTYYGIADLLAPLITSEKAVVLPMQNPAGNKPLILEICPASILKRLGLYSPYKGRQAREQQHRQKILDFVLNSDAITLAKESLRERILQNTGGDALDSFITACRLFELLKTPTEIFPQDESKYRVEGLVYF